MTLIWFLHCVFISQGSSRVCVACVGHLFSVSPISSPVAYSQSIKLNLMSKLPSPLQKSRCILSCLESFQQKNRQAAHKWTYFRQKKNRPIPRTWTSLLACFPSAAIGFFLRQSSPVDYQQLWFCFPVQKMATPPRLRSSSSCTPKTTIATAGGREFQTDEPVVCRAKRAAAACMKESERGKGGEEKQTTLGNPSSLWSCQERGRERASSTWSLTKARYIQNKDHMNTKQYRTAATGE